MSIAFLDPGNIESDLQTGAVAGFKVTEAGRHGEGRGQWAQWVETPGSPLLPDDSWIDIGRKFSKGTGRKVPWGSAATMEEGAAVGCLAPAPHPLSRTEFGGRAPQLAGWLRLNSSPPPAAAVGAALGHRAGLTVPETRRALWGGDRPGPGRGLPPLLPKGELSGGWGMSTSGSQPRNTYLLRLTFSSQGGGSRPFAGWGCGWEAESVTHRLQEGTLKLRGLA